MKKQKESTGMTFAPSCIAAFELSAFCLCSLSFACILVLFTKAPLTSAQCFYNCTLFARLWFKLTLCSTKASRKENEILHKENSPKPRECLGSVEFRKSGNTICSGESAK
eukprot:5021-Pleurochrysis_carterae.AAC.2